MYVLLVALITSSEIFAVFIAKLQYFSLFSYLSLYLVLAVQRLLFTLDIAMFSELSVQLIE